MSEICDMYGRGYERRRPRTSGGIVGDVLELACGTGQWTRLLTARAHSVTAVDAAAEMLAVARGRTGSSGVRFVKADVFEWRPPRRYDTVFFGFWLSHVPPARLGDFWDTVFAALTPGGKAIFVDDGPAVAAHEEVLAGQPVSAVLRRLDDGDEYRIVKVFHEPRVLTIVGIAEPPLSRG